MATSGVSEGGFSGRSGFVLRYTISRISTAGLHSTWHVELHALNRSGYLSYDLSSRPFSVNTNGNVYNGSWTPDFRNGNDILLYAADIGYDAGGDGTNIIQWSASAGPAGIFGSASTGGQFQSDALATAPGAPGYPGSREFTPTSVRVEWSLPNTGNAPITEYILQWSQSPSFQGVPVAQASVGGGTTSYTVNGLSPGVTYWYRVLARNQIGQSPWSDVSPGYTQPPGAPSEPLSPSISGISPTGATLSWSPPANNNGGSITGYKIQRSTSANFTTGVVEYLGDAGASWTWTDLSPSTTYYFRVAATNASNSYGPWSTTATATTASGVYVSNGNTWIGAGIFVSDGATWKPATAARSTGSAWVDAI